MAGPNSLTRKVRRKKRTPRRLAAKSNGSTWKLEPAQRLVGFQKVTETIAKLKLNTDPTKKVNIVGTSEDGNVGTDSAADSSIDRYSRCWRAALDYCFLVADYESAIILSREQCPANPFSVNTDTAIHCLRFFSMKPDVKLLHHRTNQPIKDLNGNELFCQGVWHSEHTVDLFRTAMTKLHNHYPTTERPYQKCCDDCRTAGRKSDGTYTGKGCNRHKDAPIYFDTGNLGTSETFKAKHKQMIEYVQKHYESHTNIAFLPGELRHTRTYYISHNTLYHLMLWAITIIGAKIFARVDEILTLTVEDIDKEYFVVTSENVEALCGVLEGKTDKGPVHLAMWDDKECPEFSPSRVLLIWVALSGIKSGYLFPPADQLGKTDASTECLAYETYLDEIKHVCTSVLGKDPNSEAMQKVIIGTHMLRNTGYFMAAWGWKSRSLRVEEMDEANMSQSARHSSVDSMRTYLSDAGTLKTLVKRIAPNDPDHVVSVWEPIHIKTHSLFSQLNLQNKKHIRPLHELAEWYMYTKLGIPHEQTNIPAIFKAAQEFVPDLTSKQEYKSLLQQEIKDQEILHRVLTLIELDTSSRVREATTIHASTAENTTSNFTVLPPPAQEPTTEPPSKKQKCVSEVSIERNYQQEVKEMRDKTKHVLTCIECAADVSKQLKEGKKILDNGFRRWFYRACKVAACVEECFQGDTGKFLAENKGFTVSRFKCSAGKDHEVSL